MGVLRDHRVWACDFCRCNDRPNTDPSTVRMSVSDRSDPTARRRCRSCPSSLPCWGTMQARCGAGAGAGASRLCVRRGNGAIQHGSTQPEAAPVVLPRPETRGPGSAAMTRGLLGRCSRARAIVAPGSWHSLSQSARRRYFEFEFFRSELPIGADAPARHEECTVTTNNPRGSNERT